MLALVLAIALVPSEVPPCPAPPDAISGRVTDPTGAPIPQATVKVKFLDTDYSRSVKSGQDGCFRIAEAAGEYQLDVAAEAFKSQQLTLTVKPNEPATVDIHLPVSGCTECITVGPSPTETLVVACALDAAGQPLPMAHLLLRRTNFIQRHNYEFSALDKSGCGSLKVPVGKYDLIGTSPGLTSDPQHLDLRFISEFHWKIKFTPRASRLSNP